MPSALLLFTLLYVAGVVVGDAVHCDEATARTLSLATLPFLALGGWQRRLLGPIVLGLALCSGLWAQARRPVPWDETLVRREESWRYEGQVVSGLLSTPSGIQFRVAVDRIGPLSGETPRTVQPRLIVAIGVTGQLRDAPLLPGDCLRFVATLRAPEGHRNPGGGDRAQHLASVGASAVAFVTPASLLRLDTPFVMPRPASLSQRLEWLELAVLRSAAIARSRLLAVLHDRLLADPARPAALERFGLVTALSIGDRGPLYMADAQRAAAGRTTIEWSFRAAGIYHILSVSGLHLAVASFALYHGLFWLLLYIPGLPQRFVVRRIAALCALPAVIFYTLLTGAELPTVRAAVAAVLWLLGIACGRRARLIEAMAVAILCIAHPSTACAPALALYEPSLVLSLAATLGIAYLRPLGFLIARVRPILRGPLRLIDASLAAMLITLPLCAYYFAEAQPAGVFGNLLAVPIGEFVVLPSGLVGAGLGLLAPKLAAPLLDLAGASGAIMMRVAELLGRLGLSWPVPSPSALQVALWSLGLTLLAWRRSLLGAVPCAGALLLYLIGICLPPGELRITFLDVGQGDAAVVELPQGGVIVIDAGPGSTGGRDFGELVVAPFLRHRGHRRIDLLIASHRHPDHIGGMASLIEKFPIATLWTPPGELRTEGPAPRTKAQAREATTLTDVWQRLAAAAIRRGVHVEPPRDGQLGAVTLEVLSPCGKPAMSSPAAPCTVAAQPGFGENDSSLVLRIKYAGRAILFPGDLELDGELALLDRHDQGMAVAAEVLKAPHHCSRTSSSESLLSAVAPRWVICSVGRNNRFGFPHREVLDRYVMRRSVMLSTSELGAVTLTIKQSGMMSIDSLIHPLHFPLALQMLQR